MLLCLMTPRRIGDTARQGQLEHERLLLKSYKYFKISLLVNFHFMIIFSLLLSV